MIGTKHDVLKRQIAGSPNESDMWAVLGNALRYVCHYHGATLAYLGAMGKGSDASRRGEGLGGVGLGGMVAW